MSSSKHRVKLRGFPTKRNLNGEKHTIQLSISVGYGGRFDDPDYFCECVGKILIRKDIIKRVIIMIGDSIQARSLKVKNPTLNLDELKSLAIENGKEWYNMNIEAIRKLQESEIECDVKYWHEFEEDAERYFRAVEAMRAVYEFGSSADNTSAHALRTALDDRARAFQTNTMKYYAEKGIADSEQISQSELFNLSVDYLVEECATIVEFWVKDEHMGADYEFYPNNRAELFRVLFEHLFIQSIQRSYMRFMCALESNECGPFFGYKTLVWWFNISTVF